jgi:UDP-N-acetylglucosamine 4,6-dehydratase
MRFLITGVTGTLGQAVTKILLESEENEVIGISRDEQKQRALTPHPRLKLHLADIRDKWRLLEIASDVDLIFHFAALKCVDSLEENPEECIKTNVVGTQNVLFVQRARGIKRVVLSSTDKAAYPINVYGNSKAMAEKLVLQNKNNVVCRYGNVIASRGSVVPMFVKTIKSEKTAYITHEDMTRFFIRIEDAAKFVVESSQALDGGLKIPRMKATDIREVASTVGQLLGVDPLRFEYTGVRPGEKFHECLRTAHEGEEMHSNTAEQFTRDELLTLLTPSVGAQ